MTVPARKKQSTTRSQKLEQARLLHGEIARKIYAAGITDQQLIDDVRKARAHVRNSNNLAG
jgi:hypothetical protein